MTSDAREISDTDGEPLYLVDFIRGLIHRRYTNADRPITFAGHTWDPLPLKITPIEQTAEIKKLTRTLTVPVTADIAGWWRPLPPTDTIAVAIYSQHYGEPDALVDWVGRVVSPSYKDSNLELSCEPTITRARFKGLKSSWQRGCTVALYSVGRGQCQVPREDHAAAAELIGVVGGLVLEAAAFADFPDDRLRGGYIEWIRPDGNYEQRTIAAHTSTHIILDFISDTLIGGSLVVVYPGCAHDTVDCGGTYDNILNYPGAPYMTDRSPMDGNPVY